MYSIKCIVNLSKALAFGSIMAVVAVIAFFLQKRFVRISTLTIEFQILASYVITTELFILGYKDFERVHDFSASQTALIVILSLCHCNSLYLFISHISVLIYSTLRSQFLLSEEYRANIHWTQLGVELFTLYIFCYLSAQNERELFKK